jgi:nucleoside-diphosphate-sugar epimerase
MNYLITGGAGFLGINLVRYLHSRGHNVASLDIVQFDYKDMNDKIEIITGDIRDKEIVEKSVQGRDIIVHTAAALPLV